MDVGRLLELSGTSSKSVNSAEKCAKSRDRNKSNTRILFLFSIFNMRKLFSIVSPPTFHLAPRSLQIRRSFLESVEVTFHSTSHTRENLFSMLFLITVIKTFVI